MLKALWKIWRKTMNNTQKYRIVSTSKFRKQYRKVAKQGKNKEKLKEVLNMLVNTDKLPEKYKDHKLVNNKFFDNCRECHIEPDWLLVYKKIKNELIIVCVATGSHSEILEIG